MLVRRNQREGKEDTEKDSGGDGRELVEQTEGAFIFQGHEVHSKIKS